jgi:hypothetical protein
LEIFLATSLNCNGNGEGTTVSNTAWAERSGSEDRTADLDFINFSPMQLLGEAGKRSEMFMR